MSHTLIEWVKGPDGSQGFTLNSKTGCLTGCPYCYARRLANGRLKARYLANENILFSNYIIRRTPWAKMTARETMADPFHPRFWPERLKEPYRIKKPGGFFLDDMSDWMGDYWPEEWTKQELQMMRDNPQHRIYTLTKQPQNIIKFSPFPENCWVGVTATNRKMLADALFELDKIETRVKYISIEPFLGRMYHEFEEWRDGVKQVVAGDSLPAGFDKLNWLIIGACTGTLNELKPLLLKYPELNPMPSDMNLMPFGKQWTLQPKIEWVKEIVLAAANAGIPVFFKYNLKPLFKTLFERGEPYSWAADTSGFLKQEMPKVG